MLRCLSRYRSEGLGIFVEPGEVLRDLRPEVEAQLLRDSPASFEVVVEAAKGLDAPPAHRMVTRERAARKVGERGPGRVMGKADHPGLGGPPKGGAS